MGSLALAMLLIARVRPQAMGDGVSKYTLPCNAPEAPMQWMEKYLPVITSSDSCEGAADDWLGVDNDCVCSTANETLETVAQGRVQLYGDRGYGLHLVNTSVAFYAPPTGPRALDAFVEAFDADNVSYDPRILDAMVVFYGALNVSATYAYDSPEVRKACFRWWSADVEVCYAERSEITSFYTVADFEAMNAWTDFHYAYDSAVEDRAGKSGYGIQLDLTGTYSLSTCSDDDWDWDDVDEYHFACEALANDTARVVAVSIASSSSKKKSKKADVFGVPVGDFVAEVLVAFVISAAVAVGLVWYRRASQLAGRGYVRIPWVEKEVPTAAAGVKQCRFGNARFVGQDSKTITSTSHGT
ncbi:hypothetical protein JL721_12648 [Aureococcus anophagefferens]|nr:hypothetical protein JL721_12648 [Aureococcus anophagefferens]